MTRDRLALLVTSSALLVSWLSAPASPTPDAAPSQPAPVASPPARDATTALALDVARETERLQQRSADSPGPRRSGRDPFTFGTAPRAVRRDLPPPVARLPVDAPAAIPLPAPPSRPTLRLIGIAERHAADGVVRSAILSGASDVYIVNVGDEVVGRFVVAGIDADAVELRETLSQAAVRLVLPE